MSDQTNTENVKVVVRVRPLSETEKNSNFKNIISVDSVNNSIKIASTNAGNGYNDVEKIFTFDHVFGPTSTQVYDCQVLNCVPNVQLRFFFVSLP